MRRKISPASEFDGSAACLPSRAVDQPTCFGLINQAARATQGRALRVVLCTAKTWWIRWIVLLGLVLLTTGFGQAQPIIAPDPYSFEFEKSPPKMDYYFRKKLQVQANEQQELFRIRVPIRDAIGPDVKAASSASSAGSHIVITALTQSPAASSEMAHQIFLNAVLLFLIGILMVRKFAPELLVIFNQQFNPWALASATAGNLSATRYASEEALNEFRAAFQAGPLASTHTSMLAVRSSDSISPGEVGNDHSPMASEVLNEFHSRAAKLLVTQRLLPTFDATMPDADHSTPVCELSPNELTQAFLTRASVQLEPLRDLIQSSFQTKNENAREGMLTDFYLRLNSFTPRGDTAKGHPAVQICVALEGLLKKLLQDPKHCTSSTLLTVATAVDLLIDLCAAGAKPALADFKPIRTLVVDDDPIARRAITSALQMPFEKPASADNGKAALALATEEPFDVIFLDVQMPGMDGFTTCLRIRETLQNRTTPVVFVTVHSDFKARSQSFVSGGSDLIAKPFLNAEIRVKALTYALRGRLQNLKTEQRLIQFQNGNGQRRRNLIPAFA